MTAFRFSARSASPFKNRPNPDGLVVLGGDVRFDLEHAEVDVRALGQGFEVGSQDSSFVAGPCRSALEAAPTVPMGGRPEGERTEVVRLFLMEPGWLSGFRRLVARYVVVIGEEAFTFAWHSSPSRCWSQRLLVGLPSSCPGGGDLCLGLWVYMQEIPNMNVRTCNFMKLLFLLSKLS